MKKYNYLFRLTLLLLAAMTVGATALHAQTEKITFTTAKPIGQTIQLAVSARSADQAGVWIDLNNNQTKDAGEAVPSFGGYRYYTIAAQTLTLYGKITELRCVNNQLQSLDVSQNPSLTELFCSSNQLQSLDVSKNPKLDLLRCSHNQLQSLNVANGNNVNFIGLYGSSRPAVDITGNPLLACVQVDAGFDPTGLTGRKAWKKDASAQWNNDASAPCGSQTATSIAILPAKTMVGINLSKQLFVRVEPFDAGIPALTWSSSNTAVATVDANGKVSGIAPGTASITATAGSLTATCDITVYDPNNSQITFTTAKPIGSKIELSVSFNSADQDGVWIDLNNNQTKDAGEEKVGNLGTYDPYTIAAQTLTLYGKITKFNSHPDNQLQSLDVSQNQLLTRLYCSGNQLQSLDVSQNPSLTMLKCSGNQLQSLDVSQNPSLVVLHCSYNQLQSLNVANGKNANFKHPSWGGPIRPAVDITGNPALTCVQVDAGFDPTGLTGRKEWKKDASAQWNNDASAPCGSQTATSIAIVPATEEVGVNLIKQLLVRVEPFDADLPALTWSSSDAAVATVDANGKVSGVAPGTASITATAGSLTATCDITVYDPNDYQITFTTARAVGERIKLRIDADFVEQAGVWIDLNNNQTKDAGEAVTNFNSDVYYTIAAQTLTIYGKITELYYFGYKLQSLDVSRNPSLTELSCSSNQLQSLDVSQNPSLTVLNCRYNELQSLDVSQNPSLTRLDCSYNELQSLDVSQNPSLIELNCSSNHLQSLNVANGNNANFRALHYTDPAVKISGNRGLTCVQVDAGFDPTGLTGTKEWKKSSYTQWNNNAAAPCGSQTATSIAIVPVSPVGVNLSKQLLVRVEPFDAALPALTWSSSDTAVATVDANGKVSGVAPGTASITATAGSLTATCEVTVFIPVIGVSLPQSKTLKVGETFTLIATISPPDATNKNVRWWSSKPGTATVDANGKVTAVRVGTATIRVKTEEGNNWAYCKIIVSNTAVAVTGVSLNETSKELKVGDEFTLTATVAPNNATIKNVIWSSSDSTIVTVDANGKVTGVAPGTASITATTEDGAFTATCAVTVSNVAVTGISLNETSKELKVGEEFTLTATVAPNNATNKNVIWSSSDSTIVTVDANGKVSGVAAGTASITATTEDGGFTATCAVTVSNIVVTGVSLNETSKELKVGDEFTLTATVAPNNATNKNVTWSSSDSTIVAVDANGKVTGVAAGSASITATTEDGGKTATCEVTVKAEGGEETGVEDLNAAPVRLYPNPSQGVFFVEVPSAGSLKIKNLTGQEIHTQALQAGKNKVEITQAGMYILHLTGKDYRTVRKVIVK